MLKNTLVLSILAILLIAGYGCATTGKDKGLEIQGLKNQISVLEAQIESKDQEIDALRQALTMASVEEKTELTKEAAKKKSAGEVKYRPSAKQIQTALQNAGYNPGPIDGRIGKQTREAIKAFQRANNLKVDGKVGKITWDLLKEYSDKKVK